MLEGIEPTVSTIPLGSTNKIVSGDQPSTVSRNHPQHTISFSSKYDWIPCGVIATDSNHSLSFLSVNRSEGILVSLTGNFCGYPKAPSTPYSSFCLPTLHLLSLLVIKFPPTHPTHRFFHYERYISLLRQVKYSCDTSSFTLSRGLVLPFWSLILISSPSHRPSTFELCDLLVFLSRTHNASKLCRWLGGENQRI